MRLNLKLFAIILLVVLVVFISCKKEYSCKNCIGGNQLSIAKAGLDQVITLLTDSVSLDGNASNDPNGKISEWLWTKISSSAFFVTRNSSAISVNNPVYVA